MFGNHSRISLRDEGCARLRRTNDIGIYPSWRAPPPLFTLVEPVADRDRSKRPSIPVDFRVLFRLLAFIAATKFPQVYAYRQGHQDFQRSTTVTPSDAQCSRDDCQPPESAEDGQ